VIVTERLDLVPLPAELLEASIVRDHERVAAMLDATIPPEWFDDQRVMHRRLGELRDNPALEPWLLRGMIRRDDRTMVGRIGFHTAPNPSYLAAAGGGIELGYVVFSGHRRRGYAREAILALMRWAHVEHAVSRFVLSISPANTPSLALAAHLGFAHIGSQMDEEDGPEEVFQRTMP
jgi:RimJ/RimL family protein N-acetyltransferase